MPPVACTLYRAPCSLYRAPCRRKLVGDPATFCRSTGVWRVAGNFQLIKRFSGMRLRYMGEYGIIENWGPPVRIQPTLKYIPRLLMCDSDTRGCVLAQALKAHHGATENMKDCSTACHICSTLKHKFCPEAHCTYR